MFGFLCMLPVANHQGMQSPQPSGSCFSKFWNAGRDGGQAIWSSSLWYLNKWWSGKSPCFSSVHHWTDRQSYKAVMNIVKEEQGCAYLFVHVVSFPLGIETARPPNYRYFIKPVNVQSKFAKKRVPGFIWRKSLWQPRINLNCAVSPWESTNFSSRLSLFWGN